MKLLVLLPLLLFGGICCTAQQCPTEWFDIVWSIMTDNLTNVTTTSIRDPDVTYFPDVLNYNTQQLESSIQDAFTFCNERFGLDFLQATPD